LDAASIIHQYISTTPMVAVDAGPNVGAGQAEGRQLWHGSLFMIFKGTPTLAPGYFVEEVENRGGMTNAATPAMASPITF